MQDGVEDLHSSRHVTGALHYVAAGNDMVMPLLAVTDDMTPRHALGGLRLDLRRNGVNLDNADFALLTDNLLAHIHVLCGG